MPLPFVTRMLDMNEEGAALLRKAGCVVEEEDSNDADGDAGGDAGGGPTLVINTKDSAVDMSAVFSNEKLLL